MSAVAGNLSLFTPSVLTELAAILVSAWRNAHAGKMRTLFLVVRRHNRLLDDDNRLPDGRAEL
jgi:hypothetical protein